MDQRSGQTEKGKIKGEEAARTEWRLMAEKLQNKVDVARRTPSLIRSVPQERAVPSPGLFIARRASFLADKQTLVVAQRCV